MSSATCLPETGARSGYPVMPGNASIGADRSVLGTIARAGINLAIWRRHRPALRLTRAMLDAVDDLDFSVAIQSIHREVRTAMDAGGYPRSIADMLGDDIAALGRAFSAVVGRDALAIRLEVIETDACRRFHADFTTARLICTYAGPGTQWLDDDDATALRNGADPAGLTIRQLQAGDAAILKGRKWSPDAPMVHRSPPIAGTGEQRLMLVIDPAPDLPIAHA